MSKKMRVAVIGCGGFAKCFVPLFKLHPNVEKVFACDLVRERAEKYGEQFGIETVESFEEAVRSDDIDSVALFVDRHIHGELAIKALKNGKHVYSAVPMASSVDECAAIIDEVKKSGLIYMMGETCVYYPCSMYCRERFDAGDFGSFVYGESQYFHDLSHFPAGYRNDPRAAGLPPFYYSTHSTSMILHAAGDTHVVKVTGVGYRDAGENSHFGVGKNPWDNEFSNGYSLMQLANGGTARICECRRIGYKAPSSYISGFYGTRAAYQFSNAQHIVTTLTESGVTLEDVSGAVNPRAMTEHVSEPNFKQRVANHVWQWTDLSPAQDADYARLPESYKTPDVSSGHMYSHKFLIDDFCRAVVEGKQPAVNAWTAARYTVPGLIAHESAKRGGELMEVPDFGAMPGM